MNPKYGVHFTKKFGRDLAKLSIQDRTLVLNKVKVVQENPRYQSKKAEGCSEDGHDIFRTRVNQDIRLFWRYDEEGKRIIVMLRVGHHDIWKEI